jgi:hypothetical protein
MGQPELISNARGSVDCDSSVSTRPRSNSAVKWNALQFHRTLFVRSNPDRDKQSTELRNETQARKSPKPRVDWLPESGKDGHWIEVFRCPERLQATEPDGRGYALDVIVILLG